jgi:ubiquinone/menaquinone biosynthesis C-methylase UbiE
MAQALPYASGTFAAVVSTFPSEFILHPDTLRDIYRVLRPDGRLVIVPNAVLTGQSAAEVGIEWLYRATGQRGSGDEQPQAVNRFLAPYGFETQVMQEPCKNSLATVIVATKQASA